MAKLASASNGQIPIGNGGGFTAATLTAGTNIGVTNASGAVTVGLTGTVAVANGGTGQVTIAALRTALGIEAPTRCTTQTDNTSASYADVTGMTVDVVSGTTYTLESWIYSSVVNDGTAGLNIKLTGTATASTVAGFYTGKAGGFAGTATGTSLPIEITQIGRASGSSSPQVRLTMVSVTFVCNATGTLKWQLAQDSGVTTVSVKVGSYMKLFAY
jgi:hypothetical protein